MDKKTVFVKVSFVIPVEFPANFTDEDIQREIEYGCPGTRTVGWAFDQHYETQRSFSMCWACTLPWHNQEIVAGKDRSDFGPMWKH